MTTQLDIPWNANSTLKVVNLFGGPGVGKSTTAAELFAMMKKRGYKVELLHEVAKDFVWENWNHIFREQDYIFAHQHRLQRRLVSHDIDYVIIDSSMLLGLFYLPNDFPASFAPFLREVFDSYTNINIYLNRTNTFDYVQEGRNQTQIQAEEIDRKILQYLDDEDLITARVDAGDNAAMNCLFVVEAQSSKKV